MEALETELFKLIKRNKGEGYTRQELVMITDKPRSTVYDALFRLESKYKLIKSVSIPRDGPGRPTIKWMLNN